MSDPTKRRRILEDEEDEEGYTLTIDASQAQEAAEGYVSNPDEYIETGGALSEEEEGEDLDENWLE